MVYKHEDIKYLQDISLGISHLQIFLQVPQNALLKRNNNYEHHISLPMADTTFAVIDRPNACHSNNFHLPVCVLLYTA